MNLIIPFEKKVKFSGPVKEICSISLEHEITKNEGEILGNFLVSGTYKEYELSVNKQDFNFTLPFSVDISNRIDLSSIEFSIDNFTYNLDNDELDIKIDYVVEGTEMKEEVAFEKAPESPSIESLLDERKESQEETIEEKETKDEESERIDKEKITNVVTSMMDTEDDFMTYHIHIVKKDETLEMICEHYHISLDEITKINNISTVEENDKLLIPLENE